MNNIKRIRYKKIIDVNNNRLVYWLGTSVIHGDKVYYPIIYPDFHVQIIDQHSIEICNDQARNKPEAMKKLKVMLKQLGVQLLDEVRNKTEIESGE